MKRKISQQGENYLITIYLPWNNLAGEPRFFNDRPREREREREMRNYRLEEYKLHCKW